LSGNEFYREADVRSCLSCCPCQTALRSSAQSFTRITQPKGSGFRDKGLVRRRTAGWAIEWMPAWLEARIAGSIGHRYISRGVRAPKSEKRYTTPRSDFRFALQPVTVARPCWTCTSFHESYARILLPNACLTLASPSSEYLHVQVHVLVLVLVLRQREMRVPSLSRLHSALLHFAYCPRQ